MPYPLHHADLMKVNMEKTEMIQCLLHFKPLSSTNHLSDDARLPNLIELLKKYEMK